MGSLYFIVCYLTIPYLIRAMFPWTPPSTSWPTTPQPTTASSTWPPQPPSTASTSRPPMTWPTISPSSHSTSHPGYSIDPHQYAISSAHLPGTTTTPVEHLFGQPSTLHPSWTCTTSSPPPIHPTPPPSFTTLATSPHSIPPQQLIPSTLPPAGSESTHSTLFQRHLRLQRHHHSQQHGLQLPFQFIHHRHHLHHYRIHLTHLASITLSKLRPLHRHPLQLLLDTQQ